VSDGKSRHSNQCQDFRHFRCLVLPFLSRWLGKKSQRQGSACHAAELYEISNGIVDACVSIPYLVMSTMGDLRGQSRSCFNRLANPLIRATTTNVPVHGSVNVFVGRDEVFFSAGPAAAMSWPLWQ